MAKTFYILNVDIFLYGGTKMSKNFKNEINEEML